MNAAGLDGLDREVDALISILVAVVKKAKARG
jgi:hypothetical protein